MTPLEAQALVADWILSGSNESPGLHWHGPDPSCLGLRIILFSGVTGEGLRKAGVEVDPKGLAKAVGVDCPEILCEYCRTPMSKRIPVPRGAPHPVLGADCRLMKWTLKIIEGVEDLNDPK